MMCPALRDFSKDAPSQDKYLTLSVSAQCTLHKAKSTLRRFAKSTLRHTLYDLQYYESSHSFLPIAVPQPLCYPRLCVVSG